MEQLRSKLEKVALQYLGKGSFHGLNQERIQSKKLSNVKDVHEIHEEEVFFLQDDTLFGSARDGIVFTEKAIYWREMLGNSQKMTYDEIIESTANQNSKDKTIRILDQSGLIQTRDSYYNLICGLRVELISSFVIYETYYKNTLFGFEKSLMRLMKKEDFSGVIERFNLYKGLFLKQEHKSVQIGEMLFEAYLNGKLFSDAEEELESLKNKSSVFYKRGTLLLGHAIKEEEYSYLEKERLKAIGNENFETAYMALEQQIRLNIREDQYISKMELEIKEAQFDSLNKKRERALTQGEYETAYAILNEQKKLQMRTSRQIDVLADSMKLHKYNNLDKDRLKAIVDEKYDIAFFLLEQQRKLEIKEESEIDEVRMSMERLKKRVIEKYHEKLKVLVSHRSFSGAGQVIGQIYRIDPAYPLEREEILLMIYQFKLEEAKEAIGGLLDGPLKVELEDVLAANTQNLYERIREGARNKDYSYFESFPESWNYKDEYGMSALHYFALETDIKGLNRGLEKTNLALMHTNIFGHNFLDLIGLACDPRFGNSKADALETLISISQTVKLQEIHDRIRFLKTGKEGFFFAYYLSEGLIENLREKERIGIQEARLSSLNQRLMSIDHFDQVLEAVKSRVGHGDMQKDQGMDIQKDKAIKQILIQQLEETEAYPRKREFETSKAYKKRCQIFIQQHLDTTNFLEIFKQENQVLVEKITKGLEGKKSYFRSGIAALKSLETKEGLLGLLNVYFPIKAPSVKIGNYDADKEVFYMIVDQTVKEMSAPLFRAERFKTSFPNLKADCHRSIEGDLMIDACIYEFEDYKFVLPFVVRVGVLEK